ncbi:MAG: PF20097 family protein [Planctomycetota bacterium]|nr:PF20097 family protein [Planctomycetota bacterium]
MKCPQCGDKMVSGFSVANAPISWVEQQQFQSLVFLDRDLSNSGWRKYLPSKAEYFAAERCVLCQVIVIDHSTRMDRATVEAEIECMYGYVGPTV